MSADAGPAEQPEPPRGLDLLLRLQDLALSIDRLNARLDTVESEEELRAARARLAEAEGRLGQLKLSLDAVVQEQRRLEGDVDSMERKLEAERKRLYDGTVANPKELQSIEAEVENIRSRKTRLEDMIIDQMERSEEMGGRLGPLDAEVAEARQRVAEIEETSERELIDIEKSLGELHAERTRLAAQVDEELLELYEELRGTKKGVAAVTLEDGVCQGCHQKMSAVYLEQLKRSTGIRRCEYCRRILIF